MNTEAERISFSMVGSQNTQWQTSTASMRRELWAETRLLIIDEISPFASNKEDLRNYTRIVDVLDRTSTVIVSLH
jgi:hypothetical protein